MIYSPPDAPFFWLLVAVLAVLFALIQIKVLRSVYAQLGIGSGPSRLAGVPVPR